MACQQEKEGNPEPNPSDSRAELSNTLLYALWQNNEQRALRLIKKGADVNFTLEDGKPLLFGAISKRSHVISVLLDAGADVNATDDAGKTALMHCAEDEDTQIHTYASLRDRDVGQSCHHKMVSTLLQKNANVNIIDKEGKTALMYAVLHRKTDLVTVLLEASADVSNTDNEGKTALMYAAQGIKHGKDYCNDKKEIARVQMTLLKTLIDAGADVSVTDNEGKTALIYAVQHNRADLVTELLEAGADVSKTDNKGKTALNYSIEYNDKHFACALIDADADVSVIDRHAKTELLLYSSRIGYQKVVREMIKAGIDINVKNDQGKTALMCASQHSKESIACGLIDAGADHSVIDDDGKSALFFAVINGIESVIQRLIKAGADLNITDNQGKTVLTCTVLYGRHKLLVAAELIKAGVDVNITDNKGKTALIYCGQKGEKSLTYKRYYDYHMITKESKWDKIANMLIEAGADVNITDNKGKTVLIYAVENNCEHLACALINAGGNVNIIDKEGKSALSYSIQSKDYKVYASERMACKLIKAGADVDITDDKGKTPLMKTVVYNKKNLTNALIEAGADVNISDNNGKTYLMYFLLSQHNKQKCLALINAGSDVNLSDHEGKTALFYCLSQKDIIHALVKDGNAAVNKRDKYGRSVLFYSFNKSLDTTHYLLEKGGNLNVKDNCTMSIISFWIENLMGREDGFSVHFQKLNTLVEKRIQPNTIFEAIINAVFSKIFHCKKLLQTRESRKGKAAEAFGLRSSTNVVHSFDVRNIIEAMDSAKMYIAEQVAVERKIEKVTQMMKDRYLYKNLQKIADVLVELGANPNYADADGNTALHYATCLPLIEPHETTVAMTMCHKLEELGVSFNAKNHQYETPLLFCLSKKEWINTSQSSSKVKTLVEVCKYLREHGSSVEETTRSGKSVFHMMLKLFQEGIYLKDKIIRKDVLAETMKILELFPCSKPLTEMTVNKRDADLNSPLHLWAMLELHLSSENDSSDVEHNTLKKSLLGTIFKHLVSCGVRLNGRNKNEETPIHLCRSWTAVKLLIDAGANPKVFNSEVCSPLLVTSKKNHQPFHPRFVFRSLLDTFEHNNCNPLYEDVSQEPKAFWKTVLNNDLDPWAVDNHGASVLSILIQVGAFDFSKALVEVACEEDYIQSDAIASSLLNAVCQDTSTRKQWKSILVEMILKSRKAKPISYISNEDTALHLCCRNIVKPSEESLNLFDEEEMFHYYEDTSMNSTKTSVHWTIAKQLLTYGMDFNALDASGQSCLDIANKCPALKQFLLKPLDIDEVPLAFPWTSISTKYKPILSKVARRQECKQLDLYWHHETYIQKGSFGVVFAGMNGKDGREVAIKRIEKLRNQHLEADKKEIKTLIALADCKQVVRYLSFTEDEHFCYVVLELMEGNLNDYLDGAAFDDTKSVQLCGDVLNGLKYLHQQNILHRDLKPSNILFKTYPKLCLKIADFGLSCRIDPLGTYTTSSGSVVGTRCWIAPEVLKCSSKKTKHQMACDVFSAGLVVYYILSGKKHPFSPADCENKSNLQISNETEANIIHDRMESFNDSTLCPEATDLMHNMLDSDPTKRSTAAMALTHPFFWPEKKKTDFLSAVGNQPEFECPRAYLHKRALPLSIVESELDGKLKSMIMAHPTWNDPNYVHMPTIYTEMTKKHKPYDTSSVVELVRFIRNTIAHVSEDKRPTLVKELVLESFVFLEYFPNLVIEVFKCVKMHGWDSREEIKYQLS